MLLLKESHGGQLSLLYFLKEEWEYKFLLTQNPKETVLKSLFDLQFSCCDLLYIQYCAKVLTHPSFLYLVRPSPLEQQFFRFQKLFQRLFVCLFVSFLFLVSVWLTTALQHNFKIIEALWNHPDRQQNKKLKHPKKTFEFPSRSLENYSWGLLKHISCFCIFKNIFKNATKQQRKSLTMKNHRSWLGQIMLMNAVICAVKNTPWSSALFYFILLKKKKLDSTWVFIIYTLN